MRVFATLALSVTLVACASSSGTIKVGPDTFTISTAASHGKGGVPAAKKIAYQEATDECAKRGLEVFSLSEKAAPPNAYEGMSSFELNFRCLRADDSEFQRQKLQSSPDSIIEKRQR